MVMDAAGERTRAPDDRFFRGKASVTPIAELTPGIEHVAVRGRIRRSGPRPLPGGDVVTEGHLADATGDVPFIAWTGCSFETGERVEFRAARTGSWQGRVQLELDGATDVVRRGCEHATHPRASPVALSHLAVGDRTVHTNGTVIEATEEPVALAEGRRDVCRGTIGDGVVRLPFIDWSDTARMTAGQRVRIINGYVTESRGIRSINLTPASDVDPVGGRIERAEQLPRRRIRDLRALGSSLDVTVVGTILRLLEGSGLIARCPSCGRAVREEYCRRHGPIDPAFDLRGKAVLDDGSGSLTLIVGTEITASIYGAGVEEARKEAQGRMADPVAEELDRAIVGRRYRIGGRLSVDGDEARLTAERFAPIRESSSGRARRALEGLTT